MIKPPDFSASRLLAAVLARQGSYLGPSIASHNPAVAWQFRGNKSS
jgi:hypothetical protein